MVCSAFDVARSCYYVILASHAAQAAAVEHGTGGVAVLQAADLIGQARIGIAIDLGLGIGDHIEQCLRLSAAGLRCIGG